MSLENNRPNRHESDLPCVKEKLQSLKCLDNNNYDYSKCQVAFENYKFCRAFWDKVANDRKNNNIKPSVPPSEERKEIFDHYKATGRLPNYSKKAN